MEIHTAEAVLKKIKERFGNIAEISGVTVERTNGPQVGIKIIPKEALKEELGLALTIYPDNYVDCTEAELERNLLTPIENELNHINERVKVIKEGMNNVKIGLALVNKERNAELLANAPHKDFNDLAIVYRAMFGEDGSFGSAVITNKNMAVFNLTEDMLKEVDINPDNFYVKGLQEFMLEKNPFIPMPPFEKEQMYILTHVNNLNGAITMTSTDIMDKAYERIKKEHQDMNNLLIIPSSRHEVLLIPDNLPNVETHINKIHEQAQKEDVAPADFLSNNIYVYDPKTKTVEIFNKDKSLNKEDNFDLEME